MILTKGPHFTLRFIRKGADLPPKRLRIGVPRRIVRLATTRNRWKRRIREVIRRQEKFLRPDCLLTLSVHRSEDRMSYPQIEAEILQLLKQSGVIK